MASGSYYLLMVDRIMHLIIYQWPGYFFLAIQTGCFTPGCKCTDYSTDVLLSFSTPGGEIQAIPCWARYDR
jgi:hypothetical protein